MRSPDGVGRRGHWGRIAAVAGEGVVGLCLACVVLVAGTAQSHAQQGANPKVAEPAANPQQSVPPAQGGGESTLKAADESAPSEVEQLRRQLEALEQARKELTGALDEERATKARLRQEHAVLQTRAANLEKELASVRRDALSRAGQLQKDLSKATAELAEAQRERDDLAQRLAAREAELAKTVDESVATQGRLRRELASAKAREGTLETRLAQAGTLVQELEKEKRSLTESLSHKDARAAVLQNQIDTLRPALAKVTEDRDQALAQADALRAQVARLVPARDRDAAKLHSLEEENQALQLKLGSLAARLAPADGGGADEASARREAAEIYAAYQKVLGDRSAGHANNSATRAELDRLRGALLGAQCLVARVTDASGLYTVRPRQSLSTIARDTYGDANRWVDVLAANKQVLPDPNSIAPGMILVMP